ncbi:MAG: hypothetical protein QGF59_20475, partial [Pirellulaceae bacterium]|nr:hypothetical protein [Pirellulaceae bacterium]
MSNRKLANARVELRLKVEEAILEEDLPAAANALKSFEDAHGMRSARTARSHLSVATKALLSRSLNEWQALHASASTKDTQSWLARKRKAFPKHSTDFERLRDAVSNWSTNPIALIAKGSAAETASRSPAQAPEVPASKAAVTAVMDPSATHASLSADAQDKEKARRYRDAVALWIAAGEIARKENMGRRAELEAKRQSRRLALQANAIDVIAKGINGDPRAFKKLRCLAN